MNQFNEKKLTHGALGAIVASAVAAFFAAAGSRGGDLGVRAGGGGQRARGLKCARSLVGHRAWCRVLPAWRSEALLTAAWVWRWSREAQRLGALLCWTTAALWCTNNLTVRSAARRRRISQALGTLSIRFDTCPENANMPRGDKSSYSAKQKREARHIEDGYRKRGASNTRAARIAWATVNKQDGGGLKQSH